MRNGPARVTARAGSPFDRISPPRRLEGCVAEVVRAHRAKRVGIEASGGYEQPVVAELRRQRFVVVVFQPAQVRGYAQFHVQRAKNDKIDAALIAACTAAVRKI